MVAPAGEFSYEYDSKGQVETMKGPAYVEKRTFDKAGRLTEKTLNGNAICAYEYDAMNRRTKAAVNGVSWEYKYDEFGQLTTAKSSDGKAYNL